MRLFFFVLVFFSASLLSPDSREYFVIWNVGQGQWATSLREDGCFHFDAGGEFFPWSRLRSLCQKKKNYFFLSHWDWDHLGALAQRSRWEQTFPDSCLARRPLGASSAKKAALLAKLSPCQKTESKYGFFIWTPELTKGSNEQSQVFMADSFLLPGDSPVIMEKKWRHEAWVKKATVLVLGHHGSRTSSSDELLQALPHLHQAVASARWARYHHPHAEVILRMKKYKIPLLRTEDWGHIWFEQN